MSCSRKLAGDAPEALGSVGDGEGVLDRQDCLSSIQHLPHALRRGLRAVDEVECQITRGCLLASIAPVNRKDVRPTLSGLDVVAKASILDRLRLFPNHRVCYALERSQNGQSS